mgnify:CR=1 FL=1
MLFRSFGAAWAAWVADVEVNRRTGEVHVKRVVVGHDAGLTVNPVGVEHQVHGNVIQTTSRALKEQIQTDPQTGAVTSQEWGAYPILSFREVPVIEVFQMPRPDQPSLGAGESSSVPGTAAIANAIFDATGVRFRQPPFTPEVVRTALNPLPDAGQAAPSPVPPVQEVTEPVMPTWRARALTWGRRLTGVGLGALAVLAATVGWRASIPEIQRVDITRFSEAQRARGARAGRGGRRGLEERHFRRVEKYDGRGSWSDWNFTLKAAVRSTSKEVAETMEWLERAVNPTKADLEQHAVDLDIDADEIEPRISGLGENGIAKKRGTRPGSRARSSSPGWGVPTTRATRR